MINLNNFYKGKNILVTGGAGFIGSNIVQKLVKYEAKVTVLDNFTTGKLTNLKNILNKITIIYGDITNKFTCKKTTKNKDIIFHLAAMASVEQSVKSPIMCNKINVIGTKNLLEAAVKNNVTKFIFSSSSSVYGNKNNTCKETDELNPQSPYAKSKEAGEILCKKYSTEYGIQSIILRYFNVFGDNQDPNKEYAAVISKFKYNLKNNIPITIFGDGKQTRDFIHVDKVAQANLISASKNYSHETINIATGKSISLIELIQKLKKENNYKEPKIEYKPSRKGDIQNSSANCDKFNKLITI